MKIAVSTTTYQQSTTTYPTYTSATISALQQSTESVSTSNWSIGTIIVIGLIGVGFAIGGILIITAIRSSLKKAHSDKR